ncbi:hypothetical protein U3A55_08475 [Salarchaeum sp. III]|uniref:DUF7118 family protein n=1 Tax=Salarchaeum sp. III TaxID=3107927 RepID=UPI002EDADB5E
MPSTSSVLAELDAAETAREDAESAVEEVGEDTIERVVEKLERAERLLEKYEESATGTGDFQSFVAFQGEVDDLLDELPEDFPARGAFEAYDDRLDKRRVSESDFENARDALGPAREYRELLEAREDARERYREAMRAVRDRLDTVEERLADLERLHELGNADLDAPTEELRDPIESYNDAVRGDFSDFRGSASAREFLDFAETAAGYPLVGIPHPPSDLDAYVADAEAGEKPISELLEFAEYSVSKLDHYVEQPQRLKRAVGGNTTYLDRLDAAPLTVEWPPLPADELRYRARELVAVVARFADDETVALAREVRNVALRGDYDRLRTAAVAEEDLTDEERAELESGAVDDELEAVREEREKLEAALD